MAPHQDEAGPARTNAERHPLDPLSGEEIRQAAGILRRDGRTGAALRFVSVSLHEPPKSAIASVRPGQVFAREAFIVALEPGEHVTYEAVVSLTAGSVVSLRPVPGVRAPVTLGEYAECERLVRADQDFRYGLKRGGIHDP